MSPHTAHSRACKWSRPRKTEPKSEIAIKLIVSWVTQSTGNKNGSFNQFDLSLPAVCIVASHTSSHSMKMCENRAQWIRVGFPWDGRCTFVVESIGHGPQVRLGLVNMLPHSAVIGHYCRAIGQKEERRRWKEEPCITDSAGFLCISLTYNFAGIKLAKHSDTANAGKPQAIQCRCHLIHTFSTEIPTYGHQMHGLYSFLWHLRGNVIAIRPKTVS